MSSDQIKNKIKRELLVSSIFRYRTKFRFTRGINLPIQHQPFQIGLRIKNLQNKVFPGGKISSLVIKSSENKSITEPFEVEFSIPNLNPDQEFEVWVPYAISTDLSGLVWISCRVTPVDQNDEIITYQIDRLTGVERKWDSVNQWGNSSYILGRFEYEQSNTNRLIFILTILTFLQGIFGLRNIALWVLQLIASFFLLIGGWISSMVK